MDWYCALTEHLLNKNNIMPGTESFKEVIEQLEKAVAQLYRALLLYQMKSVCSYYRKRGIGFLRGLANLDDWDGDLAHVKNAEIVVQDYSEQHYREYQKSSLRQLVDTGFEMDKHLGNIHQDLREFIALQKTTSRDDEDKECLQDLFAVDPQYDLKDLEERKDKLLDDAYDWVLRTDEYTTFTNWLDDERTRASCHVLWINGHAGTGRQCFSWASFMNSPVSLPALTPSLSYFLCQGTDQTRNSATIILRSLIWQLLVQQPCLISHLRHQRRNAGAPLLRGERVFYVLSDALQSMLKDPCLSPVYFAIDALDECDQKTPGLDQLLQLIDTSLALSTKVKWLLSSRQEVVKKVHAGVKDLKNLHALKLPVDLDHGRLEGPVNAYIDHKLDRMKGKDGYDTDTLANLSDEIRQRAMSTFLWVALTFKELDGVDGWDAVETIQRIPSRLYNVYDLIMTQIEKESPENQKRCKNILVALVLAYRTLSLPELAVLAGLQPKINPRTIVEKCGSFLTMSGKTVSLIHQSAKEYLVDNYTTKLASGAGQGHADISARSINAMGSILKPNIYALPYPGFRSSDVTPPDPDPMAPIRYSCIFWIGHLYKAKDQGFENELTDGVAILRFLKGHFLHWLEALSLIGGISESIRLLSDLLTALDSASNTELSAFLRDMHRFILFFRQVIDLAPLQAYFSGLVFAPQRSLIRQTFGKSIHNWISQAPVPELDWSPSLYTIEVHESPAISVAFSATGDRLASGFMDGNIKIWDTATGDCTKILQGHTEAVSSVTFLKSKDHLASASVDHAIKIWDTTTGDCVQIFQGHDDQVCSVSFSATSEQLASGSLDGTIKIWDIATRKCVRTLDANDKVYSVAFSNTGERLAAGLQSGYITIWHAVTGDNIVKRDSHSGSVWSVAFSANDKRLASGHSDKVIKIWDTATGQCMQTLEGHRGWVSSVSFSATGDQLALAGSDIKVWDMAIVNHTTPTPLQSLRHVVAFSASGHRLTSASSDGIIKIWDTATGKCIPTLEGQFDIPRVSPIAFSMAGDRVALGSWDGDVHIWDAVTGKCTQLLKGQGGGSMLTPVAFSATGEQLASASRDGTIRIWDTLTGKCMQTFKQQGDDFQVTSVALTSEQLASGSRDGTIRILDIASGDCIWRIRAHTCRVLSLAFSGSGDRLASFPENRDIKIWNTATRDCIQILDVPTPIGRLRFGPTSTYLHTKIGRIKVDVSCLSSVTASEARGMTKEQSNAEEDSREAQAEENSEGNDDELEGNLFEEEESAEESPEENTPGTASVSNPIVHYGKAEICGYSFSPDRTWITHDGRNFLWLPPEYRTECYDVCGHMIAIGSQVGSSFSASSQMNIPVTVNSPTVLICT